MKTQPIKEQSMKAISIFLCCAYDAYKDQKLLDELVKHLSSLKKQGRIFYWYGRMIGPGKETIHEIDYHLDTADIILLMVSPDFISSDYCDNQVKRALERQRVGAVIIVPIILRPSNWKDTLFGMLQPLPAQGKPITTWSNRDEALLDVTSGIRQIIDELAAPTSIIEHQPSEEKQVIDESHPVRFPHVTLIDASLDSQDSPYEQSMENEKKKIRLINNPVEQKNEQLDIERVIEQDHIYYHSYKYRFPTIDFKFVNTGNATAFLWKFTINVLQSEIDTKPTFSLRMQIEGNELEIIATNNGWGEAQNCSSYIDEPILNRLFSEADRRFIGTIASGEERRIFLFSKANANNKQFEAITKEFIDVPHHYPKTIRGIKLNTLVAKWTCSNDKGIIYEGKEHIQSFDGMGEYVLTYDGFFKNDNWRAGGGAPSELTYSVILNPVEGSHEQSYAISRQIPPGDIERFHIMIGAAKSCHLLIQFKIFVNETKIIESGVFDVDIWNPRNSGWHYGYKDGEELKRDIENQQNLVNSGQVTLDFLRQIASNYPFIEDLRQKRGWLLDE